MGGKDPPGAVRLLEADADKAGTVDLSSGRGEFKTVPATGFTSVSSNELTPVGVQGEEGTLTTSKTHEGGR